MGFRRIIRRYAHATGIASAGPCLDIIGRNSYRDSMKSIISDKGQVTIPKAVRTKLGLRPGTVLEFEADRGRLIGRKAGARDVVDEVYGSLKMDEPVDDYIERVRGR